jgi:hypothetical protein
MEKLVNFEEDGKVIMHVTWISNLEMPYRSAEYTNVGGQATRPRSEPWNPQVQMQNIAVSILHLLK